MQYEAYRRNGGAREARRLIRQLGVDVDLMAVVRKLGQWQKGQLAPKVRTNPLAFVLDDPFAHKLLAGELQGFAKSVTGKECRNLTAEVARVGAALGEWLVHEQYEAAAPTDTPQLADAPQRAATASTTAFADRLQRLADATANGTAAASILSELEPSVRDALLEAPTTRRAALPAARRAPRRHRARARGGAGAGGGGEARAAEAKAAKEAKAAAEAGGAAQVARWRGGAPEPRGACRPRQASRQSHLDALAAGGHRVRGG